MTSNISVGPSFKGQVTIKTVKDVNKLGNAIYNTEVITHRTKHDPFLIGYIMAKLNTVKKVTAELVEDITKCFSKEVGAEIKLPNGKFAISEDIEYEPVLRQRLSIITEQPKAGDTHLFYDSEV